MFPMKALNFSVAGVLSMGLLTAPAFAESDVVLHSFQGPPNDGAAPYASLINVDGVFYGTTIVGGANNAGTVFKMTTAGVVKVLHSFGSGNDGAEPTGGLIAVGGELYGTTNGGGGTGCGGSGCGTVFKITTGGSGYKTLYSFKGPPNDGVTPFAGLTDVGGVLYGTTQYGGTGSCTGAVAGCGTVFRIPTAGGGYKRLYSFKGPPNDGAFPLASLTDVSGVLYGTTFQGGAGNCATLGLQGCGTVFKITTAGVEEVLHSFDCCSGDGSLPAGGLIAIGSSLYGTTADGGIDGDGTVFKITTGGSVEVLYSFGGPIDGALPLAGLTEIGGVLYGTTFSGGTGNGGVGNGTVFKITTAGVETVLHLFKGPNTDGSNPYYSGLIDFKGELYGTTSIGGKSSLGTVFKIAP